MKGNRITLHLAAAAGLLGAWWAPSALAQTDGRILEEVVVTASKRAESLQDVSFAVSALDQDGIESAQFADLKDISFLRPELDRLQQPKPAVNSSAPFIRGIGQDDSTPVQEQGVAIYMDDIYMARSQGALLDLIDFERGGSAARPPRHLVRTQLLRRGDSLHHPQAAPRGKSVRRQGRLWRFGPAERRHQRWDALG